MKLEPVTPVEYSKMDSKEPTSDQTADSVNLGVNGNGIENGNGHRTEEISQNGDSDVTQKSKSASSAPVKLECQKTSDETSKTVISEIVQDGEEKQSNCNSAAVGQDSSDKCQDTNSKVDISGKKSVSDNKDTPVESKEVDSEPMETYSEKADKKEVTVSKNDTPAESRDAGSESMETDSSEEVDKKISGPEKRSVGETDFDCSDKKDEVASSGTATSSDSKQNQVDDSGKSEEKSEKLASGNEQKKDTEPSDGPGPRRSSQTSCLGKKADNDLEKVKSGGLTLKLDSGEEFSVQLADDDEEEEAKSHCKTSETNSDDDVTVVKVESKPKRKAEIHVTYGGPGGTVTSTTVPSKNKVPQVSRTIPVIRPTFNTSAAPIAPGGTNIIQAAAGNVLVPVQFPPTSLLKPGQVTVPVLLNTQVAGVVPQVNTVKSIVSTAYKPASTVHITTPAIDPVAQANYEKAKEAHVKKVAEYEKLSSFLTGMRKKVTIKSTVDALRDHVVKLPEYQRAEAAKKKALAWKTDPDNAAVTSDDTDQEKSVMPVISIKDAEGKVDDETEPETTDVKMKTSEEPTEGAESTDAEMRDDDKGSVDDGTEKGNEKIADEEKEKSDEKIADEEKEKSGEEKEEEVEKSDRLNDDEVKNDDEKVAGDEQKAENQNKDDQSKVEKCADVVKTVEEEKKDDDKIDDTKSSDDKKKDAEGEKAGDVSAANEDAKLEPAITMEVAPGEKAEHEEAAKKLRPVARFLYYSGLDLAREYIYKDLLDKQEVLLDSKKLSFGEEEDFYTLRRIYAGYRRKNRPLHPKVKKCRSCNFQTESSNAMHYHQEHGHVDLTSGRYECALCDFDSRAASAFKFHMEAVHNMVGRVTVKPCFWHCDMCPYEHNNKSMVIKHKMKCGKKFDIKKHLFPTYDDINFLFRALPGPSIGSNPTNNPPVAPKPAGSAWSTVGPKPGYNKSYNSLPASYTTATTVKPQVPQVVTYMTNNGPVRVQLNTSKPVPQLPSVASSKPALIQHLSAPSKLAPAPTSLSTLGKRLAAPATLPTPPAKVARSELEICEICGGFIKDRHSLRLHFKMAHCIEIDEAVITSKHTAPLSCDICSKRFWTFQGLTMHRVAMNHIPSTNTKSARGSKCFICSVFVADIMKHINSTHNMIPGQLNTIRICPVCGHTMSPGNLVSHLKLLHNMVLPIPGAASSTPQPAPSGADQDVKKVHSCPSCKRSFVSIQSLNNHINHCHSYKCHLCDFRCTHLDVYKAHITKGHKKTAKQCTICKKSFIGAAYTVHIQKEHCRKLYIKLERCDHLRDLFKGSISSTDKAAPSTTGKTAN